MFGRHLIFSGSATQTIIALSTKESEFYSAVRGACQLLGMTLVLKDRGFEMATEMRTNSSASKGFASCLALRLQQAVSRRRRLMLVKEAGATLSPDFDTKADIASPKMRDLQQQFDCTQGGLAPRCSTGDGLADAGDPWLDEATQVSGDGAKHCSA